MTTQPHLRVVTGGTPARESLRELYQKYGGSVYGRCVYLLRDRSKAEDAMQDVFAKALQNHDGFRAEASPLTWLMKITTHHCLNVIRAERAGWRDRFAAQERQRDEANLAGVDAGGGASGPQVFELRDEVRKLLGRCDLETQAMAVHYHVDEMTLDEVAALLGRSVPTVRKRLEDFARICGRKDFGP